jgi:hypothetical protein
MWCKFTNNLPTNEKVWTKIMKKYNYKKDLGKLIEEAPSGKYINDTCDDLKHLLLVKNIAYGNSALNPIRVFAKSDTVEQLYVRIDDKLNRLKNGKEFIGDNDIDDLLGYLILLKIATKKSD